MNKVSGNQVEISTNVKVAKSENIHINYYSIQYHKRKIINKSKFSSVYSFGLGYVEYHNTGKEATEDMNLNGSTYGLNLTISFEFRIFKHLSFHISPNFFMAVLSQYLQNGYTVTLTKKESLTRIDANSGISVVF